MVFLEISQNSQENTCARVSFLIKLQKETLAQVFSCEFCEISKNTFFYRTPLVAAAEQIKARRKKAILSVQNFCKSLEEVFTFNFDLNYKHFGFSYLIRKVLFCIFSTKPLRTSCEEVHI